MYGLNRSAGAVASVKNIKNPIKLARKVFEQTEHVLLVGEGAESFAKSIGEAIEDSAYFHSEKNLKRLRKVKNKITKNPLIQDKIGTVGAVALDKSGNISAATSTGGMTNKMPGRVGDTPIIGSGTWAQNKICGVSSTGHGEFFIKFQVAKEVCTRIEYLNQSLEESSQDIIDELKITTCLSAAFAAFKPFTILASTFFQVDSSPLARGVFKRAESYKFKTDA